MKNLLRHIALLVMAAACLGSCDRDATQEDGEDMPVPETYTPIAFTAQQGEENAVTRADIPLNEAGVTSFKVWGYKNNSYDEGTGVYGGQQQVFPGYTVNWADNSASTSTTNSSGWEYVNQQPPGLEEQTIKYWDWNAKAYRFFGVTGESSGTPVDYGTYVAYEITITADGSTDDKIAETPYYSHLWFSNDEGSPSFEQPVLLEFLKPLSKVRFMFTFEDPTEAPHTTLTDKSFRPTNGNIIKTNGEITISYPLTGTATKESFAITSEAGGISEFTQDFYETVTKQTINEKEHVVSPYFDALETQCNKVYAVLPAANQGTYTLTVSVNGEPKTTVVPAEFMNWKEGFLYTYIFKVHVDGGVSIDIVQSAFTQWEIHEADHTVYNW